MKRFSEQFKKESETIRMRASEREALKARIVSYMEYHPLPSELQAESGRAIRKEMGVLAEPFKVITLNKLYTRSFAGLFALLLIVSIPVLAEHALPGDVLYPVKIDFNEQLRSSLALSPYAKVEWETERVERRIAEARLLASEGKLTDATENQVAQAVKDHTDAAQQEIAQLRESDKDGAAIAEITLSSALDVQSQVLASNMGSSSSDASQDGHSVAALAVAVAEARDTVQAATNSQQPSYEKLLARIELESTHATELFAAVGKEASPDEVADVQRRLADIQRKIDEANALKASASNTAVALAPEASSSVTTTLALNTSARMINGASSSESASTSAAATMMASSAITASSTASSTFAPVARASSSAQEANPTDLLRSALSDLQKVMSYLTNIDVRQSVSIEELVPITPTTEERFFQISKVYDDARSIQARVMARTLDPQISEKAIAGENELEDKLTAAAFALKSGDLDAAQEAAQDAHSIATDLDTLTQDISSDGTTQATTSTTTASSTNESDPSE